MKSREDWHKYLEIYGWGKGCLSYVIWIIGIISIIVLAVIIVLIKNG